MNKNKNLKIDYDSKNQFNVLIKKKKKYSKKKCELKF